MAEEEQKSQDDSNKRKQEIQEGGETTLNRVRTYQDAIKEALQTQSMSAAKMLMTEQRKRDRIKKDTEASSLETPRNKILFGISIGLIFIAIIVLVIIFITRPAPEDPLSEPKSVLSSMFLDPNSVAEVASAQLSRNTILKLQQTISGPLAQNKILQIILTKEVLRDPSSSLTLRRKVAYQTPDILALIEARAPDTLRRSLDPNYFLGSHSLSHNEPFIVFKITNFNNVFAGMFQWERTLVRDMEPIFFRNLSVLNQPTPVIPLISSTSATGTTLELPQRTTTNTRIFEDEVIRNTDARAIKNASGEVIFFYTYIDEEFLFFGTNPTTLQEVRNRIRSAKLVL